MICFTHYRGFYTLRKCLHYFSAFIFKKAPIGGRTYSLLNIFSSRKAFLWSLSFVCCTCLLLFGLPEARAQIAEGEIKPLEIGDTIPEALWNLPLRVVNHPEGKETVTLNEYKDKLIILDFWATWCAPCVKGFPKLRELQNEFGDKVKILSVTTEDMGKINTFFNAGAGKEYSYINTVVNDKILSTYFPYKTVPHVAWITPEGKIFNTTTAESLTDANIQAVLQNQEATMITKVDADRNRPLFLSEHFEENMELKSYSIFAKGYYPGLPMGNKIRKTKDGKIYGRQMTNASIMYLYTPPVSALFEKNGEMFNPKRTIIEVSEPTLLNHIVKSDGSYENHNLYNYEFIVPEKMADSIFYYMLEDLNRYSDYIGAIEKRLIDCLVLVRTSTEDKIRSKGEKPTYSYSSSYYVFINRPIGHMINIFNGETSINPPIIDETGYTETIDIKISEFTDLKSLRKQLNQYDLDVVPAKRSLNMFVLKDK